MLHFALYPSYSFFTGNGRKMDIPSAIKYWKDLANKLFWIFNFKLWDQNLRGLFSSTLKLRMNDLMLNKKYSQMKSSGTHENVNSDSLWVTGEFLLISLFFSTVSLHYSCAYILILKSSFFPLKNGILNLEVIEILQMSARSYYH